MDGGDCGATRPRAARATLPGSCASNARFHQSSRTARTASWLMALRPLHTAVKAAAAISVTESTPSCHSGTAKSMLQLNDWRLTTYTSTRLKRAAQDQAVEDAERAHEHALAREHADHLPAEHADMAQHAELGAPRERRRARGEAHAHESDDHGDRLESHR